MDVEQNPFECYQMQVQEYTPQLGLKSKVSIRCSSEIESNGYDEGADKENKQFSQLRSMEEKQNMRDLKSLLKYGSQIQEKEEEIESIGEYQQQGQSKNQYQGQYQEQFQQQQYQQQQYQQQQYLYQQQQYDYQQQQQQLYQQQSHYQPQYQQYQYQ